MGTFFETYAGTVEKPQKVTESGEFWRKEDPILDENNALVTGGMWEHQRAFWSLPNFIKVLVGGYGAGKTNIGCKRVISMALQNAPCPVAVVSPSFPLARRTVIETLIGLLGGKERIYGRRQFWWKYNKSLHEFYIRFRGRRATIYILSGDNPLGLRGPNLGGAYIDEPFIQDVEVFNQMIARIRHPDAPMPELILTGTPEQLNWGYDLCVGEMEDQHDVGYVQASTRANRVLGDAYVKRLEGAFTDKAAEAYIDGKFVNLGSGLVYYGFSSAKDGEESNVVDLPLPDSAELGVGMDFNVNPMSAVVFWRAGNHMHVFDEIELPNADTEYMCSVLREKYGSRLHYVYPDASGNARKTSAPQGRTDFWYIRDAGFTIRAHHENPKRKDRYNAVNGKFRPKTGKPSLTIAPSCKKLIKYLNVYSHENMHKQEHMSHLLDAFSYPVEYLFPVSREAMGQYRLQGA